MKCINCQKDTVNPKFCSRSCAATFNNRIPKRKRKRKCSRCDSLVRKWNSSLCEEHFKENQKNKKESLLDLTVSDYSDRDCIKKLHPSSKFAHIRGLCRSWNKDKLRKPCHNCGYSKHVELAHIKALSSFPNTATLREINSSDNIVQLCPNCHWEFDNGLINLSTIQDSNL